LQVINLQGRRSITWSDFLGVNANFLWFSPAQSQQQIRQLQALGLQWVRVDLHWYDLEPVEGRFLYAPIDVMVSQLAQVGLQSVLYMVGSAAFASSAPPQATNPDQYPPASAQIFASRMAALAARYPSVAAWQVWNEPNLPAFWQPQPDPVDYGELLLEATQAIQQAAPGKPVVMAGMAYYSQMPDGSLMLQDLAKLGALGLGDIVAYHPYSQYPEGDNVQAQDFLVRSNQLNSSLRAAGVPAIWATEWGWSSYVGPVEEQNIIGTAGQADDVLRRLVLMSTMDYDRIFLFTLSDLDQRATPRDQSYGLLDLQGNPKPAYTALENFLALTGPTLTPASPPPLLSAPPALYSVGWARADGRKLWMFWSANAGSIVLSGLAQSTLHQPLTGASASITPTSGQVSLACSEQLQILEWG
jgi:beta-xylosidase